MGGWGLQLPRLRRCSQPDIRCWARWTWTGFWHRGQRIENEVSGPPSKAGPSRSLAPRCSRVPTATVAQGWPPGALAATGGRQVGSSSGGGGGGGGESSLQLVCLAVHVKRLRTNCKQHFQHLLTLSSRPLAGSAAAFTTLLVRQFFQVGKRDGRANITEEDKGIGRKQRGHGEKRVRGGLWERERYIQLRGYRGRCRGVGMSGTAQLGQGREVGSPQKLLWGPSVGALTILMAAGGTQHSSPLVSCRGQNSSKLVPAEQPLADIFELLRGHLANGAFGVACTWVQGWWAQSSCCFLAMRAEQFHADC